MCNNETELYDYEPEYFNGDWFIDKDWSLYIVPTNEGEIDGPDNELCERLLNAYKDGIKAIVGLQRIPECLKRFDPQDGYFHA